MARLEHWLMIWPGLYPELAPAGASDPAQPSAHLRGVARNRVIASYGSDAALWPRSRSTC